MSSIIKNNTTKTCKNTQSTIFTGVDLYGHSNKNLLDTQKKENTLSMNQKLKSAVIHLLYLSDMHGLW